MAIIGTFTYEFNVILPIFAEFTFKSGPSAYAAMTAAMGIGAVLEGCRSQVVCGHPSGRL